MYFDVAERKQTGVSSDKPIVIDLDDYDVQGTLLVLLYMEVLIFTTFISTCLVSTWLIVAFIVVDVDVIKVQSHSRRKSRQNQKKDGYESEADDADNAFVVAQNHIGRAQSG